MKSRLITSLAAGAILSAAFIPFGAMASVPTVSWQRFSTDTTGGRNLERFVINHADSVARLCFMQLARPLSIASPEGGDAVEEINAGFYCLTSPKFGNRAKAVSYTHLTLPTI